MSFEVLLKADDKRFVVEHGEAVLEAALKAGLNVAYGCNNGNCGLCSARLLKGEIHKVKDSDYVFAENLKVQNYFLMCSHTPISDITVDAEIADSSMQIPIQQFRAKLSKVDKIAEQLAIVRMRVARSHRLRFMAGQSVVLKHRNYGNQYLPIASCPCDATELEFHIQCDSNESPRNLCEQYRLGEWFDVEGPYGHFTFSENLERPVVLIACDTGFASIKSLIEHIVAQESEVPIHLYRTSSKVPVYLENLCFAWRDALDQLKYSTLTNTSDDLSCVADWMQQIACDHPQLSDTDFYLCLPAEILDSMKAALLEHGALADHVFDQPS